MADIFYTYSIATYFPSGIDLDNLTTEIQSSNITRSLRSITSDSTNLTVTFVGSDALAQSDLDLLQGASFPTPGGIIAAHNPIAIITPDVVSINGMTFADDGRQATYTSPRPMGGYSSYFTGAGDDLAVGDGNKLILHLLSTDATKYVEASFNEEVLIKDGFVVFRGAPFGSTVSAAVYHPTYGKIGGFVNRAPIIGSTFIHFNTDDYGVMPIGTSMRITVDNSSGLNGEDPPADFVVAARVEMYRTVTV
jgi:hypothetical protein